MSASDSEVLSMAGRELIRNRYAAESDAVRLASHRDGPEGSWQTSEDWRVKLGAASALSQRGAPQLAGVPEVQSLLRDQDKSIRHLAAETLEASAAQATPASEGEHRLLTHADWRVQCGALQALARRDPPPMEHAEALAQLLASDTEEAVRGPAKTVLRRLPKEVAIAAIVAVVPASNCNMQPAEEFLVDLLEGKLTEASDLLPSSEFLQKCIQEEEEKERQEAEEAARRQVEKMKFQQEQQSLQERQLQQLELLPVPSVVAPPAKTETRPPAATARRAHYRRSFEKAMEREPLPPVRQHAEAEIRVSEAASYLQTVEEMKTWSPEVILERSPEMLKWFSAEDETGISAGHGGRLGVGTFARANALEAFGRLGSLASPVHITAITKQLTAPEANLRGAAALALGALQRKDLAEELAKLFTDIDPKVRRRATQALAGFGPDSSTIAVSVAQLRHPDEHVRVAAHQALIEMDVGPGSESERSHRILTALIPHFEPILYAASGMEPPEAKSAVAAILNYLKTMVDEEDSENPALALPSSEVALLEDNAEKTRANAARALRQPGAAFSPSSAAEVAELLADGSEVVRQEAAKTVGQLRGEFAAAAIPVAVRFLRHNMQTVRRCAAWSLESLGELASEHDVARRMALLFDEEASLRAKVVEELTGPILCSKLGPEEVKGLTSLCLDQNWAVRVAVARGLGNLHIGRKELVMMQGDADWRVRKAAQLSAQKLPRE